MGKLDEVARRRVAHWLNSQGITQAALAEKIDRNAPWISRYLDAAYDADLDTLAQIAAAFDRSLFELLDVPAGPPEETELIERFRATRESARAAALVVLREMTAPVAGRPRTRTRAGGRLRGSKK